MNGLMGQKALDMQNLINLVMRSQGGQEGAYGAAGGWGGMHPSQGENPIAKFAQMVMQGAGGMGGQSAFQTATGMDPMQAMQVGQQQAGPQAPPMGAPPQEQQMPPALQAMYLKFMDEAASIGITDPGEQAEYASAMVKIRMQEQGQ